MSFDSFFNPLEDVKEPTRRRARVAADMDDTLLRAKEAARAAEIELTGEMFAIMSAVFVDLSNIFITGGAGVGKTTFLKHILINELDRRGVNFAITASTGIAGSHVQGKTLHSFLGIGLGPAWPPGTSVLSLSLPEIMNIYQLTYERWQNNPKLPAPYRHGIAKKLINLEVLILEEISMIAGWGLLGYVDFFLKQIRGDERPFGGIQLIGVGDFSQLPPVEKAKWDRADWAFLCEAWTQAKVRPMKLTKTYRQKSGWFVDLLNRVRDGIPISAEDMVHLRPLVQPGVNPTTHPKMSFLTPTNDEADSINRLAVRQFPGPSIFCDAHFEIYPKQLKPRETIEEVKKKLVDGKLLAEVLELRVGLPVLITVNNSVDTYVNGTKGYIHKIMHEGDDPTKPVLAVEVRVPEKSPTLAERALLSPEELAVVEEKDTVFEFARRYYSRTPNEDPEELEPFDPAAYAQELQESLSTGKAPPMIKRRYPVVAQFPLIPATAITIHKSQGMSLDECVLRLDRSFAAGQVYVAMSRLRSPEGLILSSDQFPIFADPHASAFNAAIPHASLEVGEPLPPLTPEEKERIKAQRERTLAKELEDIPF